MKMPPAAAVWGIESVDEPVPVPDTTEPVADPATLPLACDAPELAPAA